MDDCFLEVADKPKSPSSEGQYKIVK